MADLTDIQAGLFVKITGANSSGVETNVVNSDANGNLQVILPTNQTGINTFLDKAVSGTIAALNGTVVTTVNGMSSVVFSVTGTWSAILIFEAQSGDSNWSQVIGFVQGNGNATASIAANTTVIVPCGGFTQVRVRASSFTSGTVSVTSNAGAGTNGTQVYNLIPGSLFAKAQLQDNSGNPINSDNGQILSQDTIGVSGQFRAQSVTTSAAEALGAATILVNRKFLSITPTNGTVYWGTANTVTTATGTPIFPNNSLFLSFTDNVHVYLISAGTVDCRIVEGS